MQTVTMLEFRRHAAFVLARVRAGQRFLLTYRGKPVARVEPIAPDQGEGGPDDPFYRLADQANSTGRSMTNKQIDQVLYGPRSIR